MKRIFPILLSMTSCLLLFSQKPSSPADLQASIKKLAPVSAAPSAVAKEIVAAQREVLKQQDVVLKATAVASTNPSMQPAVQQARAQLEVTQKAAATLAKQAAPTNSTPAMATREESAHLIQLVREFNQQVSQMAQSASSWELALLVTAIGLAFGSTVFSIFSWNKASAVLSAMVVVSGGIPKVIPVHERAVYYRSLKNQSYSLLQSLSIPFDLTVAECDDGGRKLQVLDDYMATKYPETTDVDSTTEELIKDLNAAKTSVAEAH